jgi:hypothetical protein
MAGGGEESGGTDAGIGGWVWDLVWPSVLWALACGAAFLYFRYFRPKPKFDNQGNALSRDPATAPAT